MLIIPEALGSRVKTSFILIVAMQDLGDELFIDLVQSQNLISHQTCSEISYLYVLERWECSTWTAECMVDEEAMTTDVLQVKIL